MSSILCKTAPLGSKKSSTPPTPLHSLRKPSLSISNQHSRGSWHPSLPGDSVAWKAKPCRSSSLGLESCSCKDAGRATTVLDRHLLPTWDPATLPQHSVRKAGYQELRSPACHHPATNASKLPQDTSNSVLLPRLPLDSPVSLPM